MNELQVIQGCIQAGQQFRGLSRGAQGSLEQEVALLHIQANLISIAESVPGDTNTTQLLAQAKGTTTTQLLAQAKGTTTRP